MSELGLESGLRLVSLEQGVFFWFSGIKHRVASVALWFWGGAMPQSAETSNDLAGAILGRAACWRKVSSEISISRPFPVISGR